jgi:hypothetical protein
MYQKQKIRNLTRSKVEVNVYNNKIQIRVQESEPEACMIVSPERKNIGHAVDPRFISQDIVVSALLNSVGS